MRCDNLFCIYYSKKSCVLEEIELDVTGSCKNCIYVSISDSDLQKKRDEQMNKSY